MTIGTVLVEAPRRAIRQGEYFMARFLAHSGWKRASFLALTAEEAPAMRDIVTLRMLADPQDAPQRAHPRERIGLKLQTRVRQGTSLGTDAAIQVTVVDASRGGVCVETPAALAVGDVLYLESPQQPDNGADFEVLRADPMTRNRYGGRFLQQEAGSLLFEQLVESARAERAARRTRAEQDAAGTPLPPKTSRRRAACTPLTLSDARLPRVSMRLRATGSDPITRSYGVDPRTFPRGRRRSDRDGRSIYIDRPSRSDPSSFRAETFWGQTPERPESGVRPRSMKGAPETRRIFL